MGSLELELFLMKMLQVSRNSNICNGVDATDPNKSLQFRLRLKDLSYITLICIHLLKQ